MVSIAIITLGICAVICTFIICVTNYALDNDRRGACHAAMIYHACIEEFCERFNNMYGNTQVHLGRLNDGLPYIDIEEVEETAE